MKRSSSPSAGAVTKEDFEKAIKDTPIVDVHNPGELLVRLRKCNETCLNPSADWKVKSKALSEIRGMLLADSDFVVPTMVMHYIYWEECLIKGMKELRSSLCREYCITVALPSVKLGHGFFRQVNVLFKSLMSLVQSSTKIMSSSAVVAAEYIAEYVRVPKLFSTISSEINSKSNSIRKMIFKMCNIILSTWPREVISHQIKVMMEMVKAGCTDADVHCRQYGRDAYSTLAERFSKEARIVFESLDLKRQRMLMDTHSMPTTTACYSVSNENASVSNKDRLHDQQKQFANNRSRSDVDIRSTTAKISADTPKTCVTSLRSKPSIPRTIRTSQSTTFSKSEASRIQMPNIRINHQSSRDGNRKVLVLDNKPHGSTHSQPTAGSIFGPSRGVPRIAPPSTLTSRSGVKHPLGTPIVKPSLISAQKHLTTPTSNK